MQCRDGWIDRTKEHKCQRKPDPLQPPTTGSQDSHWEKPAAPVSAEQEEILARVLEEDMIKMIVVSLLDNKPSLYYYYTQVRPFTYHTFVL